MRIVFLGTPSFGSQILGKILSSCHKVVAVVTQPDKTNQRGNKIKFSPVKELALGHGLPVYQFNKISTEGIGVLKDLNADIFVTAAYGQILSSEVLNIAKYGVVNVHGSILPEYRGASPVQCAILNGNKQIGVTIMQTALSVDSGDIILKKTLRLNGDENADEALNALGEIGGEAIVEALDLIESGNATYTPQNHDEATFCKKIAKEDLVIDFCLDAVTINNRIRAFSLTPGAYAETSYGRLKILKAKVEENIDFGQPKEVIKVDKTGVLIKCGKDAICPLVVQGEGGKVMPAADYFRGKPLSLGEMLK